MTFSNTIFDFYRTIKQIALTPAVGLIALSQAQAADLPVKAKAVEYVKVCSLYGAGFYYIPGTDTCIKLGGYLRADMMLGTNSFVLPPLSGVGAAHNRLSNYYTARARQDFTIDTRTATEYGMVRTFFEATFNWKAGSTSSAGTGATSYSGDGVGLGSLGVYLAFIQFAGFTMGKTVSQFSSPWTNYPANSFDGLPGGGGDATGVNQLSYTADLGQGITATISAQDPTAYYQTNIWNTTGATAAGIVTGAYGAQNFGGSRAPDIVGMVRVDQAWGLFQASVAAHNNHSAYYGPNEATGYPSDKWGWAGQLALSIKNLPTGAGDTINLQGAYTKGATMFSIQENFPTAWAIYGSTGRAGAYQSIGIAGVSDAIYSGVTAATGTGLELTTTYGFNGGFTHNWNPNWNTGFFGGWAAIRYTGAAKAQICGSAGMAALGLTGVCNPDFNIAAVGTITRWTPVKNLTFSAELGAIFLDQKYSGTITAPTVAAVAKPAAVYELKNQRAVSLLLRAQRNW
ncbi:porin [Bradyrhizobium sp. CCBAU 11361]|uniref:porin n=1 Tax=Bradyrhizobium sp. CCBAU 11361 TaxID=1630812 RepID=UPI002302A930|nr:porin [Bradyrhizobium sp. CCBAU 11361]MDA9488893.1 polymerase [Bradyrhizobium sp. CCBAU 11361]